MILLCCSTGIIIDTFSSLRSQRLEREDDVANVCLICSNKRATFERLAAETGGWAGHVEQDHDPWSCTSKCSTCYYLFALPYSDILFPHTRVTDMAYYVHLFQKDSMDFTGVEQYVHHCITTGSISWFPLNQSLTLNAAKEEDSDSDDDILNKVETVKQMCGKADTEIAGLKKDLANIEKNIGRVFEALERQKLDFAEIIRRELENAKDTAPLAVQVGGSPSSPKADS